ncbi:hypothetical protein SH584_09040 [Sphingomonas sp. LY29]|uniref:hypothetical protein n=1 Tax=Sphingomonas sp. LY29 TaxID=3095341 RepID=UPI002D7792BF|nr:hypothetical protein [Sphingomonas sp. LY29]WRP25190.1 hypothetical protein SH584_09040 [Sphingomonas sp. LY29]
MGYRTHQFDPNAYEEQGPPLRPYNWLQWAGVAIASVGVALFAAYLLGKIGVLPRWMDDPSPASFMLPMFGVLLINSRRAPATPVDEQQTARNRRALIIIVALGAVVLGAATAIEFSGV